MSELERCRPWVEDALRRSGSLHTWEDFISLWAIGHAQLWPAEKGCIVTQIELYHNSKALRVWLAGGELPQILDMTRDVAEWAKAQGCSFAEFSGRLGWEKPLKRLGWKKAAVVMRLDLEAE